MPRLGLALWLALLPLCCAQAPPPDRLGAIEFYGYTGLDTEAVLAALPLHEGDALPVANRAAAQKLLDDISAAAKKTSDKPVRTLLMCCDANGQRILFIGLQGLLVQPINFRRAPTAPLELPAAAVKAYDTLDQSDAAARAWAGDKAKLLKDTVVRASDARLRAIAAALLAYVTDRNVELDALLEACADPDEIVRASALHSLLLFAQTGPQNARRIPLGFLATFLNSPAYFDRLRAAQLLAELTVNRNQAFLEALAQQARASLLEMAQWRSLAHARAARTILARMEDVPEPQVEQYVLRPPQAFGRL